MERESFEDEEVSEVLNRDYVSIKVDREERPDIDSIYMSVCQALTGHGGWPLTVLLTPDAKPFYAGTYFPKHDRMGMPGLMTILKQTTTMWRTDKGKLLSTSEKILDAMGRTERKASADQDPDTMIQKAYDNFRYSFDSTFGGFGNAPKFPTPHNLIFLLRYWYARKEPQALQMVEKTLDAMYRGGIFDHLGFGFSRYSTDRKWLVPHFEKMLYDNALLAIAYLETYKATQKEVYAQVARKIFAYISRDMTSPEGAFYSAEDADSEGVEGKFYVWKLHEIKQVLGESDGEHFARLYDVTEKGNFEHANILNLINIKLANTDEGFVEHCRKKLFDHREKRVHPFKDDKILTAWNGLMIAALSMGGRLLGDASCIERAEKALTFITHHLVTTGGRLLARYRDGEASILAYSEDYAFLVWGLLELYESTYKPEYLKLAIRFNDDMLKLFWDEKEGGLFLYGSDAEELVMRPKELYDGAIPSGNSVAAHNLIALARLSGESRLEEYASRQFEVFNSEAALAPHAHAFYMSALLAARNKSKEVIITGDFDTKATQDMLQIVRRNINPWVHTLVYTDKQKELSGIIPHITHYKAIEGASTAYICENFSCQSPVTDLSEFERNLLS